MLAKVAAYTAFWGISAFWWGFLIWMQLSESVKTQRRAEVKYWQEYFKENVANEWRFYDGLGG